MTKLLSITFDDGLKQSTDIAISVLNRYKLQATFYIVTGWVEPSRVRILEPYNVGRSHGTWDYWRQVAVMGHEIGSHTYAHRNARGKKALVFPWMVPYGITNSLADLRREVPQTNYTIAMPWNAATWFSTFFVRRGFSSCRLGTSEVKYNDLASLSPYSLESWAPSSRHQWSDYVDAIDGIPEGGWLILQFHGLGDEGWDPITTSFFDNLCKFISDRQIYVASVRDVINGNLP